MTAHLDAVCCARLPADALGWLGGLRASGTVRVLLDGDWAWAYWDAADNATVHRFLPLPNVELYERREGSWYRLGTHLPANGVPDGTPALPLARVLIPAPVEPAAVPDAPLTLQALRLVPDTHPRPAAAMRCRLTELARWADGVTAHRLRSIHAVTCGGDAVLFGRDLPAIPEATRFWGRSVLLPLGFRVEPELPESGLREALGLEPGEAALVTALGTDVIPRDVGRPLTRAAVRLATREAP